MTASTSGTSRPLAATSVTMSNGASPLRKALRWSVRACWSKVPYIAWAFLSGNTTLHKANKSSAWWRVATKTMVSFDGSGTTNFRQAQNAATLSLGLVRKKATRSVSDSFVSCSNRMRATSSFKPARANCARARGIVALNSKVCLDGAIARNNCWSCNAKPISNSRSASSKTASLHADSVMREAGASSSKCASRPGVAWRTAGRFARALNWPSMLSPPTNGVWEKRSPSTPTQNLAIFVLNLYVCRASSRVGDRTVAEGGSSFRLDRVTCCSSGIKKAAVLPAPVRAMQATSRPSRAAGRTARCTGVGCEYMPRTPLRSCASRPKAWKPPVFLPIAVFVRRVGGAI
mmetsp:Transcript_15908/g.45217  ORF Transcript_15908/g.45217 Transcript_15908/m.45217 type:complete len:346 (-) Transcript_15908:159-1196(-)